jgi:UDP-N-acetylglucosamine--N-acetylmuramyl-(pentapeptide) pyrophosphoryl-undecaprenol N-acetylglucosamine transferase
MRRIVFTGGGSAGHVTVNIALIPRFREDRWEIDYIGSADGIEKQLVAALPEVTYHAIATGKLRRYFDWRNFLDPFRVAIGIYQAYKLIRKRQPDVVFSKGGFVSVPVVLGAWLNRVPVILHESDLTPGLANRIAIPFSTGVCTTFPETADMLPQAISKHTGAVIRDTIRQGNPDLARTMCNFHADKPVLLIMGGSLGARRINQVVRDVLPQLLANYQIVHLCGQGQVDPAMASTGYVQFDYVQDEMPHLLAMADLVVSRAGSNAIFELLVIPLTKKQSRGDQILNARSFERAGFAGVLEEERLTEAALLAAVDALFEQRESYRDRMSAYRQQDAIDEVYRTIRNAARRL